jgi:mannose-6-phosphate isomerase-like protein (cupin superfamily)
MKLFKDNIETLTVSNTNFRKVLHTDQHSQLVVMSLLPYEDIGMETHEVTDQFIRIEKGEGKAIINGEEYVLKDGSTIIVAAGINHNIINTSSTDSLKLYTVYSPAHHKDGVIHATKKDAEVDTTDHI